MHPALSVMGYVILSNRKTEGRSLWLQVCSVFLEHLSFIRDQSRSCHMFHQHPFPYWFKRQRPEDTINLCSKSLRTNNSRFFFPFRPDIYTNCFTVWVSSRLNSSTASILIDCLLWEMQACSLIGCKLTDLVFPFPAHQNSVSGQPSRVSTEPREFDRVTAVRCSVHSTEELT